MKPVNKVGWRPGEFAEAVGLSRATVYELLKEGKLASIKHDPGMQGARIILISPSDYLARFAEAEGGEA